MFDIKFFRNSDDLKGKIINPNVPLGPLKIYNAFEKLRSREPFIFNIESTNACNMKCIMCPRPKLMKRKILHMDKMLFKKVISQIKPHKKPELNNFWKYIKAKYGILPQEKSENSFYFYTVSNSLILHGYGEPPLDPYIIERIRSCSERNIPTYFSCVPANIDVNKTIAMMTAGLGTIKFAMDALDDKRQKEIRGEKSDFTNSYKKIRELIKIKSKDPALKTKIAIIMLDLCSGDKDKVMLKNFYKLWNNEPVFAYIKSQDNRWFYEEDPNTECKSHYACQYCEFPWTSMTIMADGSVVPCTQDYNCEMVFGNVRKRTLAEIWNSNAYAKFRRWHINGDFPKNYKCVARCDQTLICDRLKEKHVSV